MTQGLHVVKLTRSCKVRGGRICVPVRVPISSREDKTIFDRSLKDVVALLV